MVAPFVLQGKGRSVRRTKYWEKFSSFKERGEWVELQFMAAAAQRRFAVSKPWGDTLGQLWRPCDPASSSVSLQTRLRRDEKGWIGFGQKGNDSRLWQHAIY
jgi:hypothetical protein